MKESEFTRPVKHRIFPLDFLISKFQKRVEKQALPDSFSFIPLVSKFGYHHRKNLEFHFRVVTLYGHFHPTNLHSSFCLRLLLMTTFTTTTTTTTTQIPLELIHYILSIKSHTAWQTRKSKIHSLLTQVLQSEKTIIYWQGRTTVYIYMHRKLEIVVELNPTTIVILRSRKYAPIPKYFPTQRVI